MCHQWSCVLKGRQHNTLGLSPGSLVDQVIGGLKGRERSWNLSDAGDRSGRTLTDDGNPSVNARALCGWPFGPVIVMLMMIESNGSDHGRELFGSGPRAFVPVVQDSEFWLRFVRALSRLGSQVNETNSI